MTKRFFEPDRKAHRESTLQIADSLYVEKVKKAGLYGKAFFGHKRTRSENWLLEKYWNEAVKEAVETKKLTGRRRASANPRVEGEANNG